MILEKFVTKQHLDYFTRFCFFRQEFCSENDCRYIDDPAAAAAGSVGLLLAEGHAVGALVHGGIGLVGTHQDAVQGTVVGAVAVISTLGNGTLDALVGVAVHDSLPPSFEFRR